jgi:hypothetical protein
MKRVEAFFWRKVDHPGYDSCRLFRVTNGWRLAGVAVFWEGVARAIFSTMSWLMSRGEHGVRALRVTLVIERSIFESLAPARAHGESMAQYGTTLRGVSR